MSTARIASIAAVSCLTSIALSSCVATPSHSGGRTEVRVPDDTPLGASSLGPRVRSDASRDGISKLDSGDSAGADATLTAPAGAAVVVADTAPPPVPLARPQSGTPARGNDRSQPWEFTLGGAGSNDEDFDVGGGQLSASVGYYLTDALALTVRQNLAFSDAGPGIPDLWNGSSRLALDYVFPTAWVRPFVGVNVGAVYGDTVKETLEAAPEAGVKFFVKEDAFIQLIAEYQFLFETSDRINDAFDNGQFVYGVDVGLRF